MAVARALMRGEGACIFIYLCSTRLILKEISRAEPKYTSSPSLIKALDAVLPGKWQFHKRA